MIVQSPRKTFVAALTLGILLLSNKFAPVQIGATFHPERMKLVDSNACSHDTLTLAHEQACARMVAKKKSQRQHLTLLVRGNVPLNERGNFEPTMLLQATQIRIQKLSGDTNFRLDPTTTRLVVVRLISSRQSDEAQVLQNERQGALVTGGSPTVELVHVPIGNSWASFVPLAVPSVVAGQLLFRLIDVTGGAWDLSARLDELVQTDNHSATTTLVYVHCMRGMDRTGLLIGTYAMRYQSASLHDVQQANLHIARRRLNLSEGMALQWAHRKRTLEPEFSQSPLLLLG